MMWIVAGVVAWLAILWFAIACARAAGKPWPEQTERFRDE